MPSLDVSTEDTPAVEASETAQKGQSTAPDPPAIMMVFSVVVLWAVVMSVLQHRSFWHALVTLYGLFIAFAVLIFAVKPGMLDSNRTPRNKHLGQALLAFVGLVVGWVMFVGSHGWWWDLLAAYVGAATGMAVMMHWSGAFRRRTPHVVRTHAELLVLLFACSTGAVVGLSVMDRWFHYTVLSHDLKRFETLAPPPRPLAVALSGGGYRAVLYHAGVLHALEQLGVRPTHISAVSGGSIVGSFYANGGEPRNLMKAVAGRRFNLKRDLADVRNAPRLAFPMTLPFLDIGLWPWWSFSRLDVQANMLDDLLFEGRTLASLYASRPAASGPPLLLLNATDVNHGLGIGMTSDGLLVTSAARAAWVPGAFPSALAEGSLARLTAISGAFPGAFPSTSVAFADRDGHPLKDASLALADGGILDNSGVRHLMVANRMAASRPEFCGDDKSDRIERIRQASAYRLLDGLNKPVSSTPSFDRWRVDVVVASDAGKPFLPPDRTLTPLEAELDVVDRSVSLAGLHASVPVDSPCEGDPPTLWLYPHRLVDLGGNRSFPVSRETVEHMAKWIPSEHFTAQQTKPAPRWPWLREKFGWIEAGLMTDLCACESVAAPIVPVSLDQKSLEDLQRALRRDIEEGVRVFDKTSTLKDVYSERDAYALFRLGMYAVFERSEHIKAAAGVK